MNSQDSLMQRNHRGVIASYKASFMPPTNRRATANGNIIPTEPHGPRRRKTTQTCTSETAKPPVDEASELRQEIIQLRLQIKDLTDQNKQQERQLERLKALIASMSEVFTMRE